MKTKHPELIFSVPDGPIEQMQLGWAQDWINIWSNGRIGYKGKTIPTKSDKADIIRRLRRVRELLREKEVALNQAWELIKR